LLPKGFVSQQAVYGCSCFIEVGPSHDCRCTLATGALAYPLRVDRRHPARRYAEFDRHGRWER
jgi:hypothetical protein